MSVAHLPAPPPDVPPDGHIPASAFETGETYNQQYKRRPKAVRQPVELPPNFERYDVIRGDAARIIGISLPTLDRWVDERLIAHLRMPDGRIRFRLSDVYRAAGVPVDPPEESDSLEP